jgi:hypothetical protein
MFFRRAQRERASSHPVDDASGSEQDGARDTVPLLHDTDSASSGACENTLFDTMLTSSGTFNKLECQGTAVLVRMLSDTGSMTLVLSGRGLIQQANLRFCTIMILRVLENSLKFNAYLKVIVSYICR